MFTPPRFVVVDDELTHLNAILDTFQKLGSPCIGIHYDPAAELDPAHFRGVRVLFLDLHLIGGALGTDYRRHYAQIAAILENNISPHGGPFVLVIWTANPHLQNELIEYLDLNLDPQKPHAKPLAIRCLEKERFINVETGAAVNPGQLRQAVEGAISSNAQLAALLSWELDVLAAAGATLSTLLALVPSNQRSTATFPSALDTILSRLAREAVGPSNVAIDPRAAITTALAPILADRIINQHPTAEVSDRWSNAVTRHSDSALGNSTEEEAGQINRMLHIAIPGPETIRPTDWGTVVDYPTAWTDPEVSNTIGFTIDQFLGHELKIEGAGRAQCRPCLVRVGAACDYAQNRSGPLKYLLGIEVPETAARMEDRQGRRIKPPDSVWTSPIFVMDGITEPFRLYVNVRFGREVLPGACVDWNVRYRIREQLLMHLISHESGYSSRPAIVQMPV